MKKIILAIALVAATMLLSGCGNDKIINGTQYSTFGMVNEDTHRDPKILYEISPGSVIVAIIFSETLIIPLYIIGWDLWQPVKAKSVTE